MIVRTVLLCLFLPAMFWDKDGRGLHDKSAGTVIVRTDAARSAVAHHVLDLPGRLGNDLDDLAALL